MDSIVLVLVGLMLAPEPGGTIMTYQERVIVRVPLRPRPPQPPREWVEKGSKRCLNAENLTGAVIHEDDTIDLVMRGGERWRMTLQDSCPGLGFYRGFYIRQTNDGEICARRDSIHDRSGGECGIGSFKRLVPAKETRERP